MNWKAVFFGMNNEHWTWKQHLLSGLFQTVIWAVVVLLWNTVLKDSYLFGWMKHNDMHWLWLLVPLLCFLKRSALSMLLTLSNLLGLFVGQYLGDHIQRINEVKITAATSAMEEHSLRMHYGWPIWLLIFSSAFLIYALPHMVKALRKQWYKTE